MTRFARFALFSATVVAVFVGAPSAAASPEADFCQSMVNVGFTNDCASLTALARDVCAQKDQGVDLGTVVERLDLETRNENLTNYIIAGAQLYFCPQRETTA